MSADLAFTVEIDRIPAAGGRYDLAATPAQCAEVARRLGVLEVKALAGHFEVKVGAGAIARVSGKIHAELVQACVVSLAPVPATIDEEIEATYIAAERLTRKKQKDADEEEMVGLDSEDPPEVAEDGRIDLGELAVTQLALVLDPYPRAPGVAFSPAAVGLKASEEGDPEPAGPFAALAKLKKTHPK